MNFLELVEFGRVWLSLVEFGRVWSSLVDFGQVWSSLVEFGRVWSFPGAIHSNSDLFGIMHLVNIWFDQRGDKSSF